MATPFLSLLFVNYRSAALLKRAIESWQIPLKGIEYEVIVVNNDPGENEAVSQLAISHKVIVKNVGENVGFGKANNMGAQLAQGQWLFLLNPDTEYRAGSFTSLLPVLETYPNSLGGIQILDREGKEEVWSGGPFPTLSRLLRNHLFGAPRNALWSRSHFTETDWVSGAALLISRASFKTLEGFDETFFLYFEDVDLAKRAKHLGMQVWRSPLLTVRHEGGASQSQTSLQKQVYYASERRYFLKHRPALETKLFTFLQRLFFA